MPPVVVIFVQFFLKSRVLKRKNNIKQRFKKQIPAVQQFKSHFQKFSMKTVEIKNHWGCGFHSLGGN